MIRKIFVAGLFLFFSSNSFAWVESVNITVSQMVMWESSTKYSVFRLSNGTNCHVPLGGEDDKELYSFMLSLYMTGKTLNLHCYDAEENIGGYTSHRIHRVNAK